MAEQLVAFENTYAEFKSGMHNLKLDRALNKFEQYMQQEYKAPWAKVLILYWPSFGIDDDFFHARFTRVVVNLAKKAEEFIKEDLENKQLAVECVVPIFEKLLVGQFKRE